MQKNNSGPTVFSLDINLIELFELDQLKCLSFSNYVLSLFFRCCGMQLSLLSSYNYLNIPHPGVTHLTLCSILVLDF